MAQARVPVFFAVSRYLKYKYFDKVWGYGPPRSSPKTNSLNKLIYGASVFWYQHYIFGDEYFDIVWGAAPPGPRNRPPKINFLIASN